MMRKLTQLFIAFTTLWAGHSHAIPESTYLTTQDVYLACKQLLADEPGIDFSAGVCGGYVIALLDRERYKELNKRMFCIPQETTLRDAVMRMNNKLSTLQSQFDQPAFSIVPYALADRFPCKTS